MTLLLRPITSKQERRSATAILVPAKRSVFRNTLFERANLKSKRVVVEETDEDEFAPQTHGLLVPTSDHLWQRRLVLIPSAVAIVLVFLAIGLWLRPIASAPRPITTIAVLPLKNLTGDQTNDYF